MTRKASPKTPTPPIEHLNPEEFAEALAVGHRDATSDAEPEKTDLERAKIFQSNFLSLISHELRTPLNAIQNALVLIGEEAPLTDPLAKELFETALRNTRRLDHQLSSLLDLAELEASAFHARLREVDMSRIGHQKSEAYRWNFKEEPSPSNSHRILADPHKVARILELFKDLTDHWGEASPNPELSLSPFTLSYRFTLKPGQTKEWGEKWIHAQVAVQTGVHLQVSFFEGSLQSEKDFLTRGREGLGSELLILQEICKRHEAKLEMSLQDHLCEIVVHFPKLDSRVALERVLISRVSSLSSELGSLVLILVKPEQASDHGPALAKLGEALFRASDSVYSLDDGVIALLLDDVRHEDLPVLVKRLKSKTEGKSRVSSVHAPTDGLEPLRLMELAFARLKSARL